MKSGIYIITNVIDNKVYIGRSKNWKNRLNQHKSELRNNKHGNRHLQNAFNLYKEISFTFELLEEYEEEFLCSMENWWCNMLDAHNKNRGYNIDATSPFGKISNSKETREKIGVKTRGRKASKQTREKLSIFQKTRPRKPYSNETRLKMSNIRIGKKLSKESIDKRSKAVSKPIIQMDMEGNFIREWNSTKEAATFLGIFPSSISNVIQGTVKSTAGFKWKKLLK